MSRGRSSVHLEPWTADDMPLLAQTVGDPELMAHLGGPESPEKIAERQARYEQPGSGMFKVVDDATGAAVGSVGFWERRWQDEEIYETGWFVLRDHQGRGIATAATAQMIELARAEAKHRFLHAFPGVENAPSNAVCRKLGFTLLGEHDFEYPKGSLMRCNDWQLEL